MRKLLIGLLALVLTGPLLLGVGVGLFVTPAVFAACFTSSLTVGPVPDSLTATTRNGVTITLDKTQLTHAATIITVAGQVQGVGRPGAVIAIMAALTESSLRMLANTSTYPESASYPNDGNGSDHDSLGMFQMRPQAGWGTVAQLMDPVYQAKAFFGGPTGPNYPSPRGLLDIPGWQGMDPGEAAQSVEVSAFPDRYQNYQPVAEAILTALTRPSSSSGGASVPSDLPETTRVVVPLPEGTYRISDSFGWRFDPFTGERRFHYGTDMAAADGTPILAAADGIVTGVDVGSGYGNYIDITHTVGGERVATRYGHMWDDGVYVHRGQQVTAGQVIGAVGSSGYSTGPHLHFEVHPGGSGSPAIDAVPWLAEHGAVVLDDVGGGAAGCNGSPIQALADSMRPPASEEL